VPQAQRGGGRGFAEAQNWERWVREQPTLGGSSAGYTPHPRYSSCTQLELQRSKELCRELLRAWCCAAASPAGPVTRRAGANASGASLRRGEISYCAEQSADWVCLHRGPLASFVSRLGGAAGPALMLRSSLSFSRVCTSPE
jgi:hypothetical protein